MALLASFVCSGWRLVARVGWSVRNRPAAMVARQGSASLAVDKQASAAVLAAGTPELVAYTQAWTALLRLVAQAVGKQASVAAQVADRRVFVDAAREPV